MSLLTFCLFGVFIVVSGVCCVGYGFKGDLEDEQEGSMRVLFTGEFIDDRGVDFCIKYAVALAKKKYAKRIKFIAKGVNGFRGMEVVVDIRPVVFTGINNKEGGEKDA